MPVSKVSVDQNQDSSIELSGDYQKSVPIAGEQPLISKKVVTKEYVIEKRWVKKNIVIPMAYEDIFVNGKRFGSAKSLNSLLQSLKMAGKTKEEKEKAKMDLKKKKHQEIKRRGEQIPLIAGKSKLEEILPLYAEKIIVNKKIVKYADAVIAKRKVSGTTKVKVQLQGEKVMIRYPDGTERTLESTAPAPSISETA